jgi:hypothetical protein
VAHTPFEAVKKPAALSFEGIGAGFLYRLLLITEGLLLEFF